MNSQTAQPAMPPAPRQERAILDQIRNDHELIARLEITPAELEALSKCALLGTLTCKEDMLFILRQIREATGAGFELVAVRDASESTTSSASMSAEDALRKIRLLSQITRENGASAAEADNARRLAKALMDRYTIKPEGSPIVQEPAPKLTWIYWQELFNEFSLQFSHFGYRGRAAIGHDRLVYVMLTTGQWSIEKRSNGGSRTILRDRGVASLRKYLCQHARTYSLLRR